MLKRFFFPLICGAITLSCGDSANAEIIYSGPLNHSLSSNLGDRVYMDIPLDGTTSFFVTAYEDIWIEYLGPIMAIPSTQPDEWLADGFYLKKLDEGSRIGPGDPFSSFPEFNYNMIRSLYSESEWTGSEGYFGFEFNPTGSQSLYGWGRLNLTTDNTVFTFVDWAYDDSGAAIIAGQVPEPTSAMLLTCGLLLAAGRCRRGRARSVSVTTDGELS